MLALVATPKEQLNSVADMPDIIRAVVIFDSEAVSQCVHFTDFDSYFCNSSLLIKPRYPIETGHSRCPSRS